MRYDLQNFRGDVTGGVMAAVVSITAAASGTDCIVTGLSGAPAASLESLDVLRRVPADQIVETLDTAREKARQLLDRPVSG